MTRRKRETSVEEEKLFRKTLKDVRPIEPKQAVMIADKPAQSQHAAGKDDMLPAQPGLDGSTAERLRRGRLEPQARLDLHGMTEAGAHRALFHFVRSSHARGLRLVLVVTGKGLEAPEENRPFDLGLDRRARGILRAMTPRWLREPELSSLIADVRVAHRRHGGSGALYVYLRKAPR